MIGEAAALAAIRTAFADPEPIIYRLPDGSDLPGPIVVIRSDVGAPTFEGVGATLRKIIYEVLQSDVPARPSKKNSFAHRGRRWNIEDVTSRDDVGAFELIVTDAGLA